jgi:MFS transporter, ACS family, glucarate transporter
MIVFAISLAIITYIDRVCISQAKPSIAKDLNLSESQMGWVFSAFTLAYAAFEIPAGYLGDKIGPRRVLMRIVIWWSFFTAASGWAWNWVSLLATRFLFGAGEAGAFPNLTKAFERWLPLAERTRAVGIMWMSARWGGAFTPFLVFLVLQVMSWRQAFALFGAIGVVWAVLFYIWYRDNPHEHPQVNAEERKILPPAESSHSSLHVPWRKLFRCKSVWYLCGQYFCCSYAWYFFITWFPSYLLQARGFNVKESALLAGLPLFLGGFGSLLAGWVTPYIERQIGSIGTARRIIGAASFVLAALLLIVSTFLSDPLLAVIAIALVSFCNDLSMPGSWSACLDVGGRYVGTLSGTMNMMGNFGGFVSPIVVGYVIQQTGNWNLTFYVTGAFYLLGAVCWLLLDPATPLEQQCPDADLATAE